MNQNAYRAMRQTLTGKMTQDELVKAVVNAPFGYRVETTKLSLGIIVLLLANHADGMIHRVALSETELAHGTKTVSVKRFEDIKIPLDYETNIIAQTIRTGKPHHTSDWQYLFAPALSPEEARLNQAGGAIATSYVYPLPGVGDGGALIFSYYQYPEYMTEEHEAFMQEYSGIVADRLNRVA